jgi:hypothetical protein
MLLSGLRGCAIRASRHTPRRFDAGCAPRGCRLPPPGSPYKQKIIGQGSAGEP